MIRGQRFLEPFLKLHGKPEGTSGETPTRISVINLGKNTGFPKKKISRRMLNSGEISANISTGIPANIFGNISAENLLLRNCLKKKIQYKIMEGSLEKFAHIYPLSKRTTIGISN